jgi:DNA-binding beta-propeller fold protein YncE
VAVDPGTHTAYVLNMGNGQAVNGNGTLSIINGTDVNTRHVAGTPVAVAVDATTHTAYVAVFNSDSWLLAISPDHTRRFPVSNPIAVAVDSSDGTVWVLEAAHELVKLVGRTQTSYPVKGDLPMYLALDSHSHIPYVLSPDGALTEVLNGRVFVKHLNAGAAAIAVDNTTGEVFVAHSTYFGGGIQHPALLSELSGFNLHLVDLNYQYVGGLAVDQSTGTAAVSEYQVNNLASGQLALVTGARVKQRTTGGTPGAVAFDSTDGAACVVNRWSSTASIVQGGTVEDVATGTDPIAAATDDSAQVCYVANFSDNTVTEVPLP